MIDYSRFRHRVHLYVNLRARRPLLHGKKQQSSSGCAGFGQKPLELLRTSAESSIDYG